LALPVGGSVDDELVGVGGEPVDGGLGEEWVAHGGEPFAIWSWHTFDLAGWCC
jgi:hypothetical protein